MARDQTTNAVETVEAIYADLDTVAPRQWLVQVLAALRGSWPESIGGVAYAYDMAGEPSSWRASYPVTYDAPSELAEAVFQSFHHAPADFRRSLFPRLGPAGTYSATMASLLTEQHDVGARAAKRLRTSDAIYLNAVEPDERGLLLAFSVDAPRRLPPAERRRLAMVSAHIASARRLLMSGRAEAPDAIFEASGAVAHVESGHEPSLEPLRERLVRLETLRRRSSPASPDDVLAEWHALIQGKYTLIQRFDTDGRRYIVAHENAPGVRDPRGLTATEAVIAGWTCRGHAQKMIAYELGTSAGTVSGMLARVYRKLRIGSRTELIERLSEPSDVTRVALDAGEELLVFSGPTASPIGADASLLSDAEREVADAVARGLKNLEIARLRGTSPHTVMQQLSSVFRKLQIGSRSELVARWTTSRGTTPSRTGGGSRPARS